MTPAEKIEYYLNKDHHKNLYFKGGIPPAWQFPGYHFDHKADASSTINRGHPIALNNLGYRSSFDYHVDALQDKKIILALGDSDTFGRSLPLQDIWPTLVANAFPDCTVLNLGLPGGAGDTISRIAVNISMVLPVEAMLVLWAPHHRREVAKKGFERMVYRSPIPGEDILPFAEYWDQIDWKANSYNFYKNKSLVESICVSHRSKFFDLDVNMDTPCIKDDFIGNYRSLGVNTHTAIANYFIKKLNGQPSFFESLQS